MTMQPSVWGSRAPDDGLRGGSVTTTQVPQSADSPGWLWNSSEWFVDPLSVFEAPPKPGRKPSDLGDGSSVPKPGTKPDLDTLTDKTGRSNTMSAPSGAGLALAAGLAVLALR